ncbi:sulfotransferase family 2 domain-containing protein [Eilatimonas milleporae]|uniref:Sulfotransferase family protein n=1 Tax=Eilatimonas milleporae TaxID=911205 RepID=A0A3M0C4P1_9PROT|nr:sulfotransferase family 2 domain-containing protein [Eilatimonas milleporae]RMB04784.1 sulfotransferase family protein [Eilatimonas milleporae]
MPDCFPDPAYSLDESLIIHPLLHAPPLPVVYANNPKVGCTSIKTALWKASARLLGRGNTDVEDIHDLKAGIFVPDLLSAAEEIRVRAVEQSFWFSVVRNPFHRILSAYLDKVDGDTDPIIKGYLCRRFDLDPGTVSLETLSFEKFLELISTEEPVLIDPHFRPQYMNLLLPYARYDFIGRMENMQAVRNTLDGQSIFVEKIDGHRTAAAEKAERYYTPHTVELVRHLFARDFQVFGYCDTDPLSMGFSDMSLKFGDSVRDVLKKGVLEDRYLSDEKRLERLLYGDVPREKILKSILMADHEHDNWMVYRGILTFLVQNNYYLYFDEFSERYRNSVKKHLKVTGIDELRFEHSNFYW